MSDICSTIWSPSWTGQAARCWLGSYRTRWMQPFALRHWRTRWPVSASPRYSTPTKAVSSPATRWPDGRLRPTGVLCAAEIKISMDGRGRWMDNVFIERLWRSVKYECVYLHAFETGSEMRAGLGRWFAYYDQHRPHSRLAGKTPGEAYGQIGGSNRGMRTTRMSLT